MYRYIVLIHILSGFFFMMSHGASAAVAFRLRHERNPDRIRALLELSSSTLRVLWLTLLLILLTGIIAGLMGRWWLRGWFWTSLVLLILITVFMSYLSSRSFYPLKEALGLPDPWSKPDPEKDAEEEPKPVDQEEIDRLLAANRPWEMAGVSLVGWSIIVWLMVFKPF